MRLNWFSPLPPAATDIAHYMGRILPALSAVAEVTLWTTKRRWPLSLEQFCHVQRFGLDRLPWRELNRADMTFYNIGNNPRFHFPIWHLSRLHPGVVVLHDLRLHHLFDGIYREHYQNLSMYLEMMEQQYGSEALDDARECFTSHGANIDYMASRYPLTQFALENALGVLVHTKEAFDTLRLNAKWPVAYAALPYPAANETLTDSGSRITDRRCRLIVFGYLGRNRRLASLFKALANLPGREKFRLDIYGSVLDGETQLRAQIREHRLERLVTLHGFVPEAVLDTALSQADLAINLRFPTVGEASGSQLRIWSHALPSLVSGVGWYATLPRETVGYVRPGEYEVEDIQTHLRSFLQSPDDYHKMGRAGLKELKEKHSPASYARTVLEIAERASAHRKRLAAQGLAKRAAESLSNWFDLRESDETLRRVINDALSMVEA